MGVLRFAEEQLTKDLLAEMTPLLHLHKEELAHYQDFPLQIDEELYFKSQELGILKLYTAREESELVGYSAFFINNHPHCMSMKMAMNDALYLHKKLRGQMHGIRFIQFCDDELKLAGINVVTQHPKLKHNFETLLKKIGYEATEIVYLRRLN